MEKMICICGAKLEFSCKIIDGDEIWVCPACEAEYIYNSNSEKLYSRDKFGCC